MSMSALSPSAFVITACASRVVDALLFPVLLLSLPVVLGWWSHLVSPESHALPLQEEGEDQEEEPGSCAPLPCPMFAGFWAQPLQVEDGASRVVGGSAASWRDRATGLIAPAARLAEAVGATTSGGWSQVRCLPCCCWLLGACGLGCRGSGITAAGTAYADPPVLPLPCAPLHPP